MNNPFRKLIIRHTKWFFIMMAALLQISCTSGDDKGLNGDLFLLINGSSNSQPANTLSYDIQVGNQGPEPSMSSNITVSFPPAFDIQSFSLPGANCNKSVKPEAVIVRCDLRSMQNGESHTLSIIAAAPSDPARYSINGHIAYTQGRDPNPGNDSSIFFTTIMKQQYPILFSRYVPSSASNTSTRFMTLYTVQPDGSNEAVLIANPDNNGNYFDYLLASYNSDLSKIALVSTANPSGMGNVAIMDMATGVSQQLTHGDNDVFSIDWSPDDAQLLFNGIVDNENASQIQRINTDGSGLTVFTSGLFIHASANWSPDGSKILYDKSLPWPHYESSRIWIMNADGSSQQQLVPDDQYAAYPSWSPDGLFVVYSTAGKNQPTHIRKMELATGTVTTLSQPPAGYIDNRPVWTDSGIVFSRSNNPTKNRELGPLYIMDADGSNLRQLTTTVEDVYDIAHDG